MRPAGNVFGIIALVISFIEGCGGDSAPDESSSDRDNAPPCDRSPKFGPPPEAERLEQEIALSCKGDEYLSQFVPPKDTVYYPIVFHHFLPADRQGMQLRSHEKILQNLNTVFSPINIQFFEYEKDGEVIQDNCSYENLPFEYENYFVEGALNIFLREEETPRASIAIWGRGIVLSGAAKQSVVVHEMGHVFGLFHTFTESSLYSPERDYPTQELVDGSNAQEKGDLLSDTPADPGIAELWGDSGKGCSVSERCEIISCSKDAKGNTYQPDVHNYMSYYIDCKDHFSEQQMQKMLCMAANSPTLKKIAQEKP